MSLIKSIKSLGGTSFTKYPLDPANYRGLMGEFFLPGGQGPVDRFIYTDYNSSLTAIENCPPLTAVILKKSAAYINGKTWVMDNTGKEAKSKFANTLRDRLLKPNPLQTWKQFEAQQQFIINAFGFSVLLPIMPVGYKNVIDCSSMWNIPPSMLDIQETGKLFYQTDLSGMLKSVVLNYKGEKTVLKSEDGNVNKPFFIFRDLLPGFCSMIFPDSRIKSLSLPISNIMGALESRGVLINYRGAMGILSSTNDKFGYVPIKPDQKKELQRDFMRYGLKQEQWKFIITSASLNWQQMGIPTKDLMLFEEIEDDVNMICDEMGYPIDLMAGSQRKTYQNAPQAWRSLYQDTIIPEADNTYDQWNMVFDCVANGCKMEKDYNHVPALQENKSEQATARKTMGEAVINEFKNNLITYNRVLELLEEDQLPGMDLYYREILANDPTFSPVPDPKVSDEAKNKFVINNYKTFDPGQPRDENGQWTDEGAGVLIDADDARRKELNIPPAWTDVKVNTNKDADLLATGKDSKGRTQYIYSENATMRAAEVKFARNKDLIDKHDYIALQNSNNMASADKSISEPASVMSLIDETGIRPGSLKETGAKVKAYGATTLEGRHVVETSTGLRLQFVGKKGVSIDIPVNDSRVALMLKQRKMNVGDNGRLFNVSDSDLRNYTKKLDGGGFKPKDFRTLKGTSTAIKLTKGLPREKDMASYKKRVMGVAKEVSKVLGNTPSIALKSYINPFVFLHLKPF